MPPKRPPPLDNPPAATSSEEEEYSEEEEEEEVAAKQRPPLQQQKAQKLEKEDDGDDEDEEEEDEEEEGDEEEADGDGGESEQTPKKGPPSQQIPTMEKAFLIENPKPQSSSSETEDNNTNDDGSGSESESGSEQSPKSPEASGFTIEPMVSKPMDAVVDKPKTASASKPTNNKPTTSKASAKRPAENDPGNGKASKLPKKSIQSSNVGGNSETEDNNSNDDGSGSESESGSEQSSESPGASDFTIKPIFSKPMDAIVDEPKTASASKPPINKPTAAKESTKRPAESDLANGKASKSPKKSKQSSNRSGEEDDVVVSSGEKKAAVNRLWNEDDEIAILKGMLEFQSKKGPDFSNDGFYEFVKDMLQADVSKNQLVDKVRRLRRKYKDNAERSKDGKDPVFSKSYEHKSFNLSKKIWGGVGVNGGPNNTTNHKTDADADSRANAKSMVDAADNNAAKSVSRSARKNGKANSNAADAVELLKEKTVVVEKDAGKVEVRQFDEGGFYELYPYLSDSFKSYSFSDMQLNELGVKFWEKNLSLVGKSKLEELEAKWKQLKIAETELFLKRIEFIKEGTSLVLNGIKSSEN